MSALELLANWELAAWCAGADTRIDNVVGTRLLGHVADAARLELLIRHALGEPLLDRRKLKAFLKELRSAVTAAVDAADAMFIDPDDFDAPPDCSPEPELEEPVAIATVIEIGGYPPKPDFRGN